MYDASEHDRDRGPSSLPLTIVGMAWEMKRSAVEEVGTWLLDISLQMHESQGQQSTKID